MPSEDEATILLRRMREHQQVLIERLSRGGVSAENVAGGYREITGQVKAFDDAIEMVREVFAPWFPESYRPGS